MTKTTAFSLSSPEVRAPQNLLALAASKPPVKTAIAGAGAQLPMTAAMEATERGLMTPLFIGNPDDINKQADRLNWDISAFEIIPADTEQTQAEQATRACRDQRADTLMKGHLHTDVFMKAVLNKEHGLRTDARLVHIFHLTEPTDNPRPLLLSDAALNVAPDLETRKASIRACADMLARLGNPRPHIALLSATESVIPSLPSSGESQELAAWARDALSDTFPAAKVSGPLAMDLILSRSAAQIKGLNDPVAGNADAIIAPDIVCGNALYKTLVYTRAACAAGIVLGARVPILLTSRADPAPARLSSVALACLMINYQELVFPPAKNSAPRR